MRHMSWEDESDGRNKIELYREILPGISDRTRQRDFQKLEKLGYEARYEWDIEGEPKSWHYDIPSAYGLTTIPGMRW